MIDHIEFVAQRRGWSSRRVPERDGIVLLLQYETVKLRLDDGYLDTYPRWDTVGVVGDAGFVASGVPSEYSWHPELDAFLGELAHV